MKTNKFIAKLRTAPENRLLFVDRDGNPIHAGYHLTELKAASFQTVDCGRQLNHWTETVVQLWVPPEADDDYMTAGKFLQIFDKVRAVIPLDLAAEIRVEYGDENFFPSIYYIGSVTLGQHTTGALLVPPATTCKAPDRRVTAVTPESEGYCAKTGSCC
jgi:hypothetical protein